MVEKSTYQNGYVLFGRMVSFKCNFDIVSGVKNDTNSKIAMERTDTYNIGVYCKMKVHSIASKLGVATLHGVVGMIASVGKANP